MPNALRHILTIAAYERIMLYRTPKFWVLAALGGLFTLLLLIGTTIASILDGTPPGEFLLEGTEAWLALYLFGYVQTVIIIFVAADFRKTEEQAHLDQVMLSRPMTTASWVMGKYFGMVSAIAVLNVGFIAVAAVARLFKVIFLGVGFNLLPAIQYFGFVTLPSILFMTALVFFLISLLRTQALAILLPLAYVGSILFYFRQQYEGLLDYGCFMAPLFHSDLIGFGDLHTVLWQRAFFVALSVTLLCGTIVLYPRLRQSPVSVRTAQIIGIMSLLVAVGVANQVWTERNDRIATRETATAYQTQRSTTPVVQIPHYAFEVALRSFGEPLQVTVRMAVHNANAEPIDTLLFALNTRLKVSQAQWRQGQTMPVIQRHNLVEIPLGDSPLAPGATDTLTLSYAGTIDADAFMLDRLPDSEGLLPKSGNGPWIKGNISAWLDERIAILPAQCGWYPTPGVVAGYPYEVPKQANFATATLNVRLPESWRMTTQGGLREDRTADGWRYTRFEVDRPTPLFSINAGPYQRLAHTFGKTEVEVLFYKGHLAEYEAFSDVADSCFQVVDGLFDLYEQTTGAPYPYPRLSFVETPLQMQVYSGIHGVDNVLLQPGVIMVDELNFAEKRFKKAIERSTQNAQRNGRDDTPWRVKRDVFTRAVLMTIAPTERLERDSSLLSPIGATVPFQADLAHPILRRGLELQFHEALERRIHSTFFPDRWDAGLSSFDQIRRNDDNSGWVYRRRYNTEIDSVMNTIQHTPLMELRPDSTGIQYRAAVDFKASAVLDLLQDQVGANAYQKVFHSIMVDHPFQRVGMTDFLGAVQVESNGAAQTFADQWLNGLAFPGYRITKTEAEKWDTGNTRIRYRVSARIENGEEGDGFVRVVFKTRNDRITKTLALAGHQEKEIVIATSDLPENVQVIPFFARNRGTIMKPVTLTPRLLKGIPVDTVFTVVSSRDSLDFIVDDQDDGFFLPQQTDAKYLRPPSAAVSWRQLTQPEAYGRYIFGFRYRWASEGDFPVRWETRVPRTGLYELNLHMPSRQPMQRQYHLTVEAADGLHETAISPQGTKGEWWPIGRYSFAAGKTAVVELSDKGKGYILADALRWTYVKGE